MSTRRQAFHDWLESTAPICASSARSPPRSTTSPLRSSMARPAKSSPRSSAGSAPLGRFRHGKSLAAGGTDNDGLLFRRTEQLLATRARILAGRAFFSLAIGGHRTRNLAQVDNRAATLGTPVQRGVGGLVLEVAPGAVDKNRSVPELEPVRAAPVRAGKVHQETRCSFLSRSAARRRVSIFLGKENRICRRPRSGSR